MKEPNPDESDFAPRRSPSKGLHWVALFAAALTWPLLISGGQVTTYKVGMAVPDWPSTFGENMFLYDFWNASVGVYKEHLHRLFGSALGFTAIVLAIWAVATDPRRWMKFVGVGALAAVCLQGLIGGLRVIENSTSWAAFHACSGQAVFALLVATVVWTGPKWWNSRSHASDGGRFRRMSLMTLSLVYLQIVLGAWLRHFPSPLSATSHALAALWVSGSVVWLIWQVGRNKGSVPLLVPSARAMAAILSIQVALGLAAFWILMPFDGSPGWVSPPQAMIRTGHQANGALLLASCVVMSIRACGDPGKDIRMGDRAVKSTATRSDLEAVF